MSSGLTFTQGLLVGQLSVVVLIGAFIKFFIFGESPPPARKTSSQKQYASHHRAPSLHSLASSQASPPQSLRNKTSSNNILRPVPQSATDTASILRKTFYQIAPNRPQKHGQSIHQPESLDWFNVLIAQTIAQYRQTAYNLKDASPSSPPSILTSLEAAINDPTKRPSFIGDIKITEISLGEEFPIFSNVRVIAVDDELTPGNRGQRLQALVDVDLSDDNLTLAVETSLILNYPKPMSAVLPVALAVSVIRFSGTLSVSFVPAPPETAPPVTEGSSSSRPKTNLAFSFLPDYRLDLSVRSLIGSRSRLQDVPKIAQLVEARVQAWFEERVVEPRIQVVGLPGLWPRMGKTRVRDGGDEEKKSQQGSDTLKPESQPRPRRVSDNFPTQEETEAMFEGLRFRSGGSGRQREEQAFAREDDMRIPGALPA